MSKLGAFVITASALLLLQLAACQTPIPGTVVLKNRNGMEAHVIPYGAIIQKLFVPDNQGNLVDVVLGYDTLEPYLNGTSPYFGAVIGRVANRIGGAEFDLNGKTYFISANENNNTLHGGKVGWNKKAFKLTQLSPSSLEATLFSPDGDMGFPGNVEASVFYGITEDNQFVIEFNATTDEATPINMAQHSYFNLNGALTGTTTLNNDVTINGSYITPVNLYMIPTGQFESVVGTPFDFLTPHTVGERIAQVTFPPPYGGYDINYVLFGLTGQEAEADTDGSCVLPFSSPQQAVRVQSPTTGIVLDISTNAPGVQFYSGNQLQQEVAGKNSTIYPVHGATVFETQVFPDSINIPEFPQCVLTPGGLYNHKLVWKFSTSAPQQQFQTTGKNPY